MAYIKQVVKLPDNLLRVLVEGTRRAELLGLEQETPYLRAEIVLTDEEEEELPQAMLEAMYRSIRGAFPYLLHQRGGQNRQRNWLPRFSTARRQRS